MTELDKLLAEAKAEVAQVQADFDAFKAEVADKLKAAESEVEALTKENASLRDTASKLQLAANNGVAPPPPGPPVLMVSDGGAGVNVGGIKKYVAEAGEAIKVDLAHVEFLLAHGFRHATPAELAADAAKAKTAKTK